MSTEIESKSDPDIDCYFGWENDGDGASWDVIVSGTKTKTSHDDFGSNTRQWRSLAGVFFISGFYRVTSAIVSIRIAQYAVEAGADVDLQMYHRISTHNWRSLPPWGAGDVLYLWNMAGGNATLYYTMLQAEYGATGFKDITLDADELQYVNTWGHTACWQHIHGGGGVSEEVRWNSGAALERNRPYITVEVEPATCRAKHGHACGPVRATTGQIAPA